MDDDNVVRFPDGEPLKGWQPAITPALQRHSPRVRWRRVLGWAFIGAVAGTLGYEVARDLVWRWTGL